MHRTLLTSLACAGALAAVSLGAAAAQSWQGDGSDSGLLHLVAKHNHHHKSGHDMLGEHRKEEGRHEIDRIKGRHVMAEVRHGKVVGMDAEDLKMKRVKAPHKMADASAAIIPVGLQLAQYDDSEYGYCFDDGVDYTCYWFPADDVDYQDYSWEPYDPNY
jgi:hypothetical protein